MTLYEGGSSVKELMFNAAGTDHLNWFSFAKMTNSSWTDITTEPRNFFSIQGDCKNVYNCRSFFINRSYNGCGSDLGWLAGSTSNIWCSWETSAAHKFKVLYSKLSTYTNWNTDGEAFSPPPSPREDTHIKMTGVLVRSF